MVLVVFGNKYLVFVMMGKGANEAFLLAHPMSLISINEHRLINNDNN